LENLKEADVQKVHQIFRNRIGKRNPKDLQTDHPPLLNLNSETETINLPIAVKKTGPDTEEVIRDPQTDPPMINLLMVTKEKVDTNQSLVTETANLPMVKEGISQDTTIGVILLPKDLPIQKETKDLLTEIKEKAVLNQSSLTETANLPMVKEGINQDTAKEVIHHPTDLHTEKKEKVVSKLSLAIETTNLLLATEGIDQDTKIEVIHHPTDHPTLIETTDLLTEIKEKIVLNLSSQIETANLHTLTEGIKRILNQEEKVIAGLQTLPETIKKVTKKTTVLSQKKGEVMTMIPLMIVTSTKISPVAEHRKLICRCVNGQNVQMYWN
jgi:hypothetical protein